MAITKEQAQRLVEVAQALVDGKRVTTTYCGVEHTNISNLDPSVPYTIHEPIPEPKWRPFKDADEFRPHRDRWLMRVGSGNRAVRCTDYSDTGLVVGSTGYSYKTAIEYVLFDDGTPCGVRE